MSKETVTIELSVEAARVLRAIASTVPSYCLNEMEEIHTRLFESVELDYANPAFKELARVAVQEGTSYRTFYALLAQYAKEVNR